MGKQFWRAVGIRAVRTMAQTAVATIGTNLVGINEVNWAGVASVAALSGVLCVLQGIATGLPEA